MVLLDEYDIFIQTKRELQQDSDEFGLKKNEPDNQIEQQSLVSPSVGCGGLEFGVGGPREGIQDPIIPIKKHYTP